MPELPEVETMVRGIRPMVEGAILIGFRRSRCACRPMLIQPEPPALARRIRGQCITSVRRRAKRIVLTLRSGEGFVIEPRMTGLMLVATPPDAEHLRAEWRLEQSGRPASLWFWDRRGLGTIRLLSAAELQSVFENGALGRDALDMTVSDWRRAVQSTRRPIKVALLDQRLVAGIGNLYASEILHQAGILPQRPAAQLSAPRVARLYAAVQDVLQTAIAYEGSTLSDGTYRNALSEAGRYQNAHRVYDRAGDACQSCAATIQRIVQAQRSTFYCPRCQR